MLSRTAYSCPFALKPKYNSFPYAKGFDLFAFAFLAISLTSTGGGGGGGAGIPRSGLVTVLAVVSDFLGSRFVSFLIVLPEALNPIS